MQPRNTTRTVTALLVAVAAGASLSLLAVDQAHAVLRACCLPNGVCEILSRTGCEDVQGGVSEAPGTTCAEVECPVLCGGSAPACDGDCPSGEVCLLWLDGTSGRTTGSAVEMCGCTPEIPTGGACNPLADACAPGLSCVDGVCAVPAARAPALSAAGLAALIGVLLALGGVRLLRRRSAR